MLLPSAHHKTSVFLVIMRESMWMQKLFSDNKINIITILTQCWFLSCMPCHFVVCMEAKKQQIVTDVIIVQNATWKASWDLDPASQNIYAYELFGLWMLQAIFCYRYVCTTLKLCTISHRLFFALQITEQTTRMPTSLFSFNRINEVFNMIIFQRRNGVSRFHNLIFYNNCK